jgi:hypothetical protein
MTRNSNDSHADTRRATKPPTQRTQNSKPSERKPAKSEATKSKQDPVNSEETLWRNEHGNS